MSNNNNDSGSSSGSEYEEGGGSGKYGVGKGLLRIPKVRLRQAFGCIMGQVSITVDFKDCVVVSLLYSLLGSMVEIKEQYAVVQLYGVLVGLHCLAYIWRNNKMPRPNSQIGHVCSEPRCLKCVVCISKYCNAKMKKCRRFVEFDNDGSVHFSVECSHKFIIGNDKHVICNPPMNARYWIIDDDKPSQSEVFQLLNHFNADQQREVCRTETSLDDFMKSLPNKDTNFCVCMHCGWEWPDPKAWRDFNRFHQHKLLTPKDFGVMDERLDRYIELGTEEERKKFLKDLRIANDCDYEEFDSVEEYKREKENKRKRESKRRHKAESAKKEKGKGKEKARSESDSECFSDDGSDGDDYQYQDYPDIIDLTSDDE